MNSPSQIRRSLHGDARFSASSYPFVASLAAQLRARRFHPVLYWTVILATSTASTTMSDLLNRSAGLGYARGALVLITGLAVVFVVWKLAGHSFNVVQITTLGAELPYWTTILFSNTLGTSLGDYLADSTGLAFSGGALVVVSAIALIGLAMRFTAIPKVLLFWMAFELTRPSAPPSATSSASRPPRAASAAAP